MRGLGPLTEQGGARSERSERRTPRTARSAARRGPHGPSFEHGASRGAGGRDRGLRPPTRGPFANPLTSETAGSTDGPRGFDSRPRNHDGRCEQQRPSPFQRPPSLGTSGRESTRDREGWSTTRARSTRRRRGVEGERSEPGEGSAVDAGTNVYDPFVSVSAGEPPPRPGLGSRPAPSPPPAGDRKVGRPHVRGADGREGGAHPHHGRVA